jgi:hypothetical protein
MATNQQSISVASSAGWFDPLAVWLLAFVMVVLLAEFLLGKAGKKWIQERFEHWWLILQYTRWKSLGYVEADFCLRLINKVFGTKLLSLRRLVSCLIFCSMGICVFYLLVEILRLMNGYEIRWPFIGIHFETGFPVTVIPVMISVSITAFMVEKSILIFKNMKYSIFYFITAILVFGILSYTLSSLVAFILMMPGSALYGWIIISIENAYHAEDFSSWLSMQGANNRNLLYRCTELPILYLKYAFEGENVIYIITRPYHVLHFAAFSIRSGTLGYQYEEWQSIFAALLRLAIAAAFITSWVVVRPGHALLSLVVLRFAEAEKGVLTAIAAGLALMAKFLHMLSKGHVW